jgi:gliding motility-associated-like protein
LPNTPENTTLVTVTNADKSNTGANDIHNPIDSDALIVVEDHAANNNSPNNNIDVLIDMKSSTDADEATVSNAPVDVLDPDKNIDNSPENSPELAPEVVIEQPSAQFTLNQTTVCVGTGISFNALNKAPNTDYVWDFGDGSFSKKKSPVHAFDGAGTFYVSLESRSSLDNSVVSKSDKIAILVNPLPEVSFEYEENVFDVIPSVQFVNRTNNAVDWSWNLGNGKVSNEKDPIVTYNKKGFYNITLVATNIEGCAKVAQQEIEVATDYNLLAPNSFTPNADGINDKFIPEALKILDVEFEMTIYDKRGLVFQSYGLNDQWDGTNQRDGGKCPQGAYAWIVKYKDHEGMDQVYKGTINLLK